MGTRFVPACLIDSLAMQTDTVEPFLDNWTYLRAELNWLDRVLGLAVARQRKETKEVDRLSRSRADKATSHWWKGLITVGAEASYDSPADKPSARSPKGSYQQQLEAKIRVSEEQGICLGLPSLKHQLQLTSFEKNLVLMALAPEISRRYGRIYNYLQETELPGASGLPTVDLILRILCRNDAEWRVARQSLTSQSILVQRHLLEVRSLQPESFLTRQVKLIDSLVNYLLAEKPSPTELKSLLQDGGLTAPVSLPLLFPIPLRSRPWSDLVLPESLLTMLQQLCHRVQFAPQVDQAWGFQQRDGSQSTALGTVGLCIGASGTGKTSAAQAIAHTLAAPLFVVDLALLEPMEHACLLTEIAARSPTVLLLKSANVWLGRNSLLSDEVLRQFIHQRQQNQAITLFSVTQKQSVKPKWQQVLNPILPFPLPDEASRLRLWNQAFPPEVPLDAAIDWELLAHQFRFTGGQIQTVAREAALQAAATSPETNVRMEHLLQACRAVKGRRVHG